ncbi:hypothetical protein [Fodinicola feengrottensis]|uniref:hypothetical protein n=1 Tax=Fodinicola feengrottensis TaxID=435914 RepID=UPI0013D8D19F|nr:hypothetical protein [Fodinicola feengrottensis]
MTTRQNGRRWPLFALVFALSGLLLVSACGKKKRRREHPAAVDQQLPVRTGISFAHPIGVTLTFRFIIRR